MGCDIHLFNETRNEAGEWTSVYKVTEEKEDHSTYKEIDNERVDRNYFLFSILSDGVRGSHSFSFAQKGVPTDMSPQVSEYYQYDEADAHSDSYLTRAELELKTTQLLIDPSPHALDARATIQNLLDELPPYSGPPENSRIVFWFDN